MFDVYYFDMSKKGKDFTGSKDLGILTNDQAILESVKNIILTEPGQHIMRPDFGCPLNSFLFSPIDYVNSTLIELTVKDALLKHEERIENVTVKAEPNEDENTYIINVYFNLVYSDKQQELSVTLKTIR